MPRTRPEPWNTFALWLQDEENRDVSPATASNYISLVRRILSRLDVLTPDALAKYVEALPVHHRSPVRAAWRRFVEWSAQKADPVIVPTFPVVEIKTLPEDVQAAIRILRQDGVTAPYLRLLTWDLFDDPAITGMFPTKTWLVAPAPAKPDAYPLSSAALNVLRTWAYGQKMPGKTDPVIPRKPGVTQPMPLATLRRILRARQ
jgi:hypothetical protein